MIGLFRSEAYHSAPRFGGKWKLNARESSDYRDIAGKAEVEIVQDRRYGVGLARLVIGSDRKARDELEFRPFRLL